MAQDENELPGDPTQKGEVEDGLDQEDEEPEPLDVTAGERKLVTQPYDFSVDQLVTDVSKGKVLLIEVPYQREYVWDEAKASRLIESLLLNVPIPVCYFAENSDGTWEVIDGLQRSQSIVRFLRGELRLRGLSVLTEFNGRTFPELPSRDQRRIETRTLRFVVITDESHPDIKFDVFERLNTGAVKLTPQELRNCIYRGTFNDQIRLLSDDPNFRQALGRPKDCRLPPIRDHLVATRKGPPRGPRGRSSGHDQCRHEPRQQGGRAGVGRGRWRCRRDQVLEVMRPRFQAV